MTATQTFNNLPLTLLTCVALTALLTACGPTDGYYDANGRFVYEDTSARSRITGHHSRPYSAAVNRDRANQEYGYDHNDREYPAYDHRGYYDRDGSYVELGRRPGMSENMFPPRGMCRVWFASRPAAQQPPVESCNGIQSRVPDGAYVIYGGR